jgi:hypothetical protein
MSERVYNRLANILMLIGIASALLFDSGRLPRLLVATIGTIAGVAAVAMYFWNQYRIKEKEKASAKREAPLEGAVGKKPDIVRTHENLRSFGAEVAILRDTADVWKVALDAKLNLYAIEAYRRETARLWLSHYAANHARTLRWHVPKDASVALMQAEVELSPNEVAACAIEIIQNLSMLDNVKEWEYVFSPKGLRVSVKKAHSMLPPQENFDFEPISSLVQ